MHRTFNMGMGMVLAVSSENADKIVDWLDERLPGTKIVGSVNDDGRKVTHIDSSVIFEHY